jgi:chromatin remodeling complex protein RSC6
MGTQERDALQERKAMMSRYLVCLIFAAALFGLSAQPPVVHAQTNQQATEPDEADQPNEENDQAASPEDEQSDQADTSATEKPDEQSDSCGAARSRVTANVSARLTAVGCVEPRGRI